MGEERAIRKDDPCRPGAASEDGSRPRVGVDDRSGVEQGQDVVDESDKHVFEGFGRGKNELVDRPWCGDTGSG